MRCLLITCVVLCAGDAFAQSAEKEPVAIMELGGAGSWNIKDGGGSLGPTVAVEFTPIENWLEIEAGVTPLFARHSTEWGTDLLFKKPWTLSKKVEFMMGIGPEWVHARNRGVTTNSVSVEVAPDFMFWPPSKRRFGWYLEPGYEYNFGPGREQSLGNKRWPASSDSMTFRSHSVPGANGERDANARLARSANSVLQLTSENGET